MKKYRSAEMRESRYRSAPRFDADFLEYGDEDADPNETAREALRIPKERTYGEQDDDRRPSQSRSELQTQNEISYDDDEDKAKRIEKAKLAVNTGVSLKVKRGTRTLEESSDEEEEVSEVEEQDTVRKKPRRAIIDEDDDEE